jgi:hypothetical protein
MIETGRRPLQRLRAFLRKPPLDADLEAEIASHIEFAIKENIQRGMTPLGARRQACIRFGGVETGRCPRSQRMRVPPHDWVPPVPTDASSAT